MNLRPSRWLLALTALASSIGDSRNDRILEDLTFPPLRSPARPRGFSARQDAWGPNYRKDYPGVVTRQQRRRAGQLAIKEDCSKVLRRRVRKQQLKARKARGKPPVLVGGRPVVYLPPLPIIR